MEPISGETLERLRAVSTATVSTLLFKRGLRNTWLHGVRRMSSAKGNMVGEAFTLRNIPCREDLDQVSVFENRDHPQRKAFDTVPSGHVLVIDCRGDTRAASGGGILTTRLKVRGAAGLVSDGCLRDSDEIGAMDFPVYCAGPAAPLNLSRHHAVDFNVPIACGGVAVYPGDLVVGDADGVIIVPRHLADEVSREALQMEEFELFVTEQVQGGQPLIGTYPPTPEMRERYAEWLKKRV
ncbi:MAG TPA: ribonuclease activity regulator RraA [Burkholderiales bacterium]|nr:ribonuclease activity regulator RraA [Burkholderiales bacterium]